MHVDIFFFQVKTHLQSQAAESIAVGHQHKHQGWILPNAKPYISATYNYLVCEEYFITVV